MTLKSLKALKGNHHLMADREHLLTAIILTCYSDQPQRLIAPPEAFSDEIIQWCHKVGVGLASEHDGIEIRGGGWSFKPMKFDLPNFDSLQLDLLQISFLRFHFKELVLTRESEMYRDELKSYALAIGLTVHSEESTITLENKESSRIPKIPKEFFGYESWLRNDRILQCFPSFQDLQFKERYSCREQLITLSTTWGFENEKEIPNIQELDELERRLLKMRGGLQDKRSTFSLRPAVKFRKRAVTLYADTTIAATIATLALLTPGSDIVLENVLVSSSRSHFFNLAKKMGALIDFGIKRESLGETFANVRVKYSQHLQGKKIAGEALIASIEEFPLLAILAGYSEGETIIRGFSKLPGAYEKQLHNLTLNLKKAGVEIGEFEDGLVIRGRSELDGAPFDAESHPCLTLAYWVLGQTAKGRSELIHPSALILDIVQKQLRLINE